MPRILADAFPGLLLVATALTSACGSSSPSTFGAAPGADGGAGANDGGGGGANGGGLGELADGGPKPGADGGCGPNLVGVLRDFHASHPDFEEPESKQGDDRGIVADDLGTDFKPVYAKANTKTTTDKASFDQWYRDTPGVNSSIRYELVLVKGANGISTFSSDSFFPLDNKGFGNEGNNHNFHFTFELNTQFLYTGGEIFKFTGDDDVWVFINRKLAIDIGGVHSAQDQSVDLDANAVKLGIEKGKTYELSIFQAERHTTQSNFRVDTNIGFTNCDPIIR